jgi:hypothetical protein
MMIQAFGSIEATNTIPIESTNIIISTNLMTLLLNLRLKIFLLMSLLL